ncbi:ATP-dependent DNA helicase RecG [Woodsholea maritima]|uniref:ATP-dependent DNA helicase RecG n=1 Tax=Woodsholea maritima TaxID=240237 RepID=UPI0003745258|nr:ATP-dependent DNA helicase RecG [Woodsholea maritima]
MRPQILFSLFADMTRLKGIGPRLAPLLEKTAGGPRVKDVLFTLPTAIIDRTKQVAIRDALDGGIVTVQVEVEAHIPPPTMRQPYKVRVSDDTGFMHLVFFHARADYLTKQLPEGEVRVISGKAERFASEIQMTHPDLIARPDEIKPQDLIQPVYPLTAGLTATTARKAAKAALDQAPDLPEWLDPGLMERAHWPSWRTALTQLHCPDAPKLTGLDSPARCRLAFDEMLAHQLALKLARASRKTRAGRVLSGDDTKVEAVLAAAPFTPTGAQMRAYQAIKADLGARERMTRLLHGDVGSGKTFVAALAAAKACEAGVQTALMAPTEILARQHGAVLTPLLKAAGIEVIVLTGRDKGKARTALLERIAKGEASVICGTHALFQDDVAFKDLGLVIIDEQHRFGVSDRRKLALKGAMPETLVMSATPIPRTLTLAVYGDLDVSRLDEKPAGRIPPETRVLPGERLDDIIAGLGRALNKGERAYWVCPLVEESDTTDLAAAEARYDMLKEALGVRVGLLHGRMAGKDKEAIANAFRAGEIDLLVATTVIEVGVDAPDATIMIIEHAERFGLAQLHQLRGRVGRGDKASNCLLLYHGNLGETARRRLEVMRESDDGFYIAEEDWKLRGSGDPLGLRQSGLPDYRFADLSHHTGLLTQASDYAKLILAQDPELKGAQGEALRTLLYLFERDEGIRLMRSA